ncbi:MAG: hypothetical protein PVJ57_22970 [Phycisphaerae bacterium]|jgi:hypothetical protein
MKQLRTEAEALCRAVAPELNGRPLYVVLASDVYPTAGNGDGPDGGTMRHHNRNPAARDAKAGFGGAVLLGRALAGPSWRVSFLMAAGTATVEERLSFPCPKFNPP